MSGNENGADIRAVFACKPFELSSDRIARQKRRTRGEPLRLNGGLPRQ
jgi:hypothetical protein